MLDALATAVLVLGINKGIEVVKKNGIEAVLIDEKGNVLVTNGLKDSFELRTTK